MEDMDSDMDMSADLNYNYDVINLKEDVTSPLYEAIKNILVVYSKRAGADEDDDEINPEKALTSPTLLAVKVQIWM